MIDQADVVLLEAEEKMEKTIESLVREFSSIRTGRANPALLDRIFIDYYGVETPLKQISSIQVVDGNQLYIKPFDKSSLKQVEHAIHASDIGITPANDGTGIRLVLPMLTEERRRSLSKDVDKIGEQAKVALRNIRRDANDSLKKLGLTEDDEKGYLEDVQKLTDKYVKLVDAEVKTKTEELMTI